MSSLGRRYRTKLAGLLPALGSIAMCAFVLWKALAVSQDLNWPHDEDLYRDLSQAQTIADGHPIEDPFYRGETLWYNPLTPWVVAQVSGWLHRPLGLVYARAGAYINLLGPLCLYLLVRRLAGGWAACAAIASYLFTRDPDVPSYTAATYSPWLLSAHLAQPLFYCGLLAVRTALLTNRIVSYALLGLVAGLTFLAHTAPALILGVTTATLLLLGRAGGLERKARWLGLAARTAVAATVAVVVSIPLLRSIVLNYGLHIRNAEPLNWNWEPFDAINALSLAAENLHLPQFIALLGFAAAAFRIRTRVNARILVAWPLSCLFLLFYSWTAAEARSRGLFLPNVSPAFHFVFWAKAAESALFGYGVRQIAWLAASGGSALILRGRALRPKANLLAARALMGASVIGMAAVLAPSFAGRADLVSSRHRARKFASKPGWDFARAWIRENTHRDDVFLASDEMALFVVGPAGRKVVAVGPVFSNPYVRWEPRAVARDAMFESLSTGSMSAFLRFSREYPVTYVISDAVGRNPFAKIGGEVMKPVFNRGNVRIFRTPPVSR
ncbi:MAG: hypothetical protein ABI672_05100 [Vicinamibacteria bacterium]